jgi:hypothetical protein
VNAFETKAENAVTQFITAVFRCGNCEDAIKFLDSGFKHTVHMYPTQIAKALSHSGVDGFKAALGSPSADFILNSVQAMKVMYGSNDTGTNLCSSVQPSFDVHLRLH